MNESACDLRVAVARETREAYETMRNSDGHWWLDPRSYWSRVRILEGELRRRSDEVTSEQLEAAGQMRLGGIDGP